MAAFLVCAEKPEKSELMEISRLLTEQMSSLLIIVMMGFLAVKFNLVDPEGSKILARVSANVIMPCVIFNSFQVEFSPQLVTELGFMFLAAAVVFAFSFLLTALFKHTLKISPAEQDLALYSNCGNLVVHLTAKIYGQSMVIFASPFMILSQILIWSHGKSTMERTKGIDIKSIIFSPNIIAAFLGVIFFMFNFNVPKVLNTALQDMSECVGPFSMFITGMILGEASLNTFKTKWKRVLSTCVLRLVIYPVLTIVLMKYINISALIENGETLLVITMLAVVAPCATTCTQLAKLFGTDEDAEFASETTVIANLLSIATIPIMITFYQYII